MYYSSYLSLPSSISEFCYCTIYQRGCGGSSMIAFLNNHDFGGFEFVSSGRTDLFTS